MEMRKYLAVLLTMVMIMSFTSITAFAADEAGTMTAVSANFASTAITGGAITAETVVTSVQAGTTTDDYTVPGLDATPIPVTREFITGNNLVLTATGATTAIKAYKYTVADDPAESGPITVSDIAGGTAFTLAGGAVEIGDVIYVVDGYDNGTGTAAVKIAKFVITMSEGGSLSGDATKKSPVYNVKVPTTLGYAIDPLQIGTISVDESQIASGTFAFANASNVPVKVSVDLDATITGTLKGSAWEPVNNTTGAPKELKLALIGAVTTTGTPTLAVPAGGSQTYTQSAGVNTLRWFDETENEASIEFLLAPGTGVAVGSTPRDNVGMFQVYAQMETYAPWAAGDIKLSGTYTLQGFKSTDYAKPAAAGTGDDPATANVTENAAYPAWNGGIPAKGATATRASATQLVGLNVMPDANAMTYGFNAGTGISNIVLAPSGSDSSFTQTAEISFAKSAIGTTVIPFSLNKAGTNATISSVYAQGLTPTPWAAADVTSSVQAVEGGIKIASEFSSNNTMLFFFNLSNGDSFKLSVTMS